MNEHCPVGRSCAPESGAVDHKARKRIEELFLVTDEIIQAQKQTQMTYDSKLYRKYKQLKEINKKLQEKLVHQHCSGCKCHAQPGGGGIMHRQEQTTVTSTNTSDPVVQKKRKAISFVELDTSESQDEDRKTILESSTVSTRQASTSTEGSVHQATTSDRPERVYDPQLPLAIQKLIEMEVQKNPTRDGHLLNIGRSGILRNYLCNPSFDSYTRRPPLKHIDVFIRKHVPSHFGSFQFMRSCIAHQLYEIHRAHVLQCIRESVHEDTIGNRTKRNERQAKRK